MMSRRPPKAPTGMPPPITLPSVVRSGVMPNRPCAPTGPTRKPVITSSKISTAPCCVHSVRIALEEGARRHDEVHVADHRLDDDAGDAVAMAAEARFELLRRVVVEHQRVPGEVGRHAARTRVAEGERAGTGLHQQAVGVAVVAALELHDRVTPGEAARQADGTHGRFGAGTDQTHLFDRRHALAQHFRHQYFRFRRRTERKPADSRLLHRADHLRMRMSEDGRAPRTDVVDVFGAVGIPQPRPAPRVKKRGVPPTERKARTGELTPPGMVRWARSKSCSLRVLMDFLQKSRA
jgi:hypothetical protein